MLNNRNGWMARVHGLAIGRWLIAVSCSAITVAACGTTTPAGQKAHTTISVPVILPLSGPQSFAGEAVRRNYIALADAINNQKLLTGGRRISLDFLNNNSSPSTAVSVASQILHKYPFFINGVIVNTQAAVNGLIGKSGPVDYNVSPAVNAPAGSYQFVLNPSTKSVQSDTLQYAAKMGWHRIAILTTTNPTGEEGLNTLVPLFKQFPSLRIVANETYAVSATSVASQMIHIAAAHPQALIIWTTGPQLGTAFEAMRSAGLSNLPVFMSYGNIFFSEMKSMAAVLPPNLYSQGPAYMLTNRKFSPAQEAVFHLLYTALHVAPGHLDYGPGFADDALLIYVNALNHLGSHPTAKNIRNYIQTLHSFYGVDGVYNFSRSNHRGINGQVDSGIVKYDSTTGLFVPAPG